MNDLQHINSPEGLEQLIERYFDGMTTVEEEALLRHMLVHSPWSSDVIDEARMVMGYFAAHRHQHRQKTIMGKRQLFISIAASIAILLAVGGYTMWQQQQPNDVCIAYINGLVVQDNDKVMALVADDMNMMDKAGDAMSDQLSSLGEALELDNE